MTQLGARAAGIANIAGDGGPLDVFFPELALGSASETVGVARLTVDEANDMLPPHVVSTLGSDDIRDVERVAVDVQIPNLHAPVRDLYDAFLRLHLLSSRLVRPNEMNLDGLLPILDHGVAWTTIGPCRPMRLNEVRLRAQGAGMSFAVRSVFPIPPMLDYVCPSGVTIADGLRVLLGAYLAPGTMVTPEGFCSTNAGTLGPCMVEGRISAGVTVGSGCHIGGGASLMGVSSGGGRMIVSLGKNCLLGANSGIGIPLGDDCIVEAGCYVTAGAPVATDKGVVKARELAGVPRLIFRRNARTGVLEAIENSGRWDGLNASFHPGE